MRTPILRCLAAMVIGALIMTACKKPEASTTTTGSAVAGAAKKTQIVYIPKNTGNPYFDGIIEGFKRGSTELGASFDTAAPAQPDPTAQIPFIKDQIQRGANIICISPNSPDALNAVFDDARAKGVKIIV